MAFDKKGMPSRRSRGQALAAGRKKSLDAKKAGKSKEDQGKAFNKAFFSKLPYIQLDVVVRDAEGNIEHIYDFKFNCDSPPKMPNKQFMKYKKTMKKTPQVIGARW
ncbi:hypothetical protein Q664_40050 [Archangium violaceum Cb vi76]|uniref:Uncharacterized protein n=1 Tax=Archangium violaceum Cb vi76 TaxID=1406225 RepID=A0A084SJI4_9BACT|nr:hypothetical protein Q664_40050 [Archangium violaceum Cb vi76]